MTFPRAYIQYVKFTKKVEEVRKWLSGPMKLRKGIANVSIPISPFIRYRAEAAGLV